MCPLPRSFPKCVTEETCNTLPAPDAASGLRIKDGVSKVKIGEKAIYECIDRATFSETPNVRGGNSFSMK